MSCLHETIVLANYVGKKCDSGGYEVDLVIRCSDCEKVLFRVSEYKREIVNLSKH